MNESNCTRAMSLLKHSNDVALSVLLIIVHVVLILMVIVSNFTVVGVIMHHKRLHTPFNFYIVSLCSSDALVGMFSLPLYTVLEFFCVETDSIKCVFFRIFRFMTDLTFMMSVYSMVAIGAERHHAVIYPLQNSYTKRQCIIRIGVIVTCSLIYALFWVIWYPAEKHPEYGEFVSICPGVDYATDNSKILFNLAFVDLTILYVIPLTISAGLYLRVIHRLWKDTKDWYMRQRQTAQSVSRQTNSTDSGFSVSWYALSQKKRAIKMCVCILIVFAAMWLPYHFFHIYFVINRDSNYPWFVFPIVNIVYFSNSWINCSIYAYYSTKFRSLLRMTLRCDHQAIEEEELEEDGANHRHNDLALRTSGYTHRIAGHSNTSFSPGFVPKRSRSMVPSERSSNMSTSDIFETANGSVDVGDDKTVTNGLPAILRGKKRNNSANCFG